MLIKIDDSIIDIINNVNTHKASKEINALNNLALAYREGHHMLIGSREVLEALKKCPLLNYLALRSYGYLSSRISFLYNYQNILQYYIIVTANTIKVSRKLHDDKVIFEVPLEYFDSIYKLNPTSLVSEDISDCEFYFKLGKRFVTDKLNKYSIKMKFIYENGGGENSHKIYEYKINQGNFVLALADTDKCYPSDSVGSTLRKLRRVDEKYRDHHIVELFEPGVREKENLVPPSYYLLCTNNSCKENLEKLRLIESDELFQEKLKYLDLKDGLKAKEIKQNKELNDFLSDLFEVPGLMACTCEDIPSMSDDNLLFGGLGNKLNEFCSQVLDDGLEVILQEKKANSLVPKEVLETIEENIKKKNEIFSNLPNYLRPEWDRLCNIIIAWGCSSHKFST